MTVLLTDQSTTISTALKRAAATVEASGFGRWAWTLPCQGKLLRASARAEDDWLHLDLPLRDARIFGQGALERLGEILSWNADISGGGKFRLGQDQPFVHLAAEIPLAEEESDLPERLEEASGGFQEAAGKFFCGAVPGGADTLPRSYRVNRDAVELPTLCQEAGWPFVQRAGGRLTVELDVPQGYFQALIQRRDNGPVVLEVELASWEELAPLCRRAIAVFLLTACGVVRMARATLTAQPDNQTVAAWEVVLNNPTATEMAHALSALSMACRFTAREVQALCDESIARKFLEVRGWSSALAR